MIWRKVIVITIRDDEILAFKGIIFKKYIRFIMNSGISCDIGYKENIEIRKRYYSEMIFIVVWVTVLNKRSISFVINSSIKSWYSLLREDSNVEK